MSEAILQAVQQAQLKQNLPVVSVGDTIDVHYRIIEGSKERIQIFSGVVLGLKGQGLERTVTVRRIVANEGVERIFPLHSPKVAKIEVKRHGHVRRAKLYYLRDRVGKKRRLQDRRRGLEWLLRAQVEADPQQAAAAAVAAEKLGKGDLAAEVVEEEKAKN